jgi:hypothetical protein
VTKITLKDYRAKCQEVDKLKNIIEKLEDQISRMVENNWNTDFSAENSDYAKKIAKLKRDVNRHHKWMWKYYNRMRTAEGLNVQYLDEIQELKGMVSSEMRKNRELTEKLEQPVTLSATPGWGMMEYEPDLSFMTIRPTSKLTIKSDLGPTPDSNITSDKKKRVAVIKVSDGGIMSYYEPEQEARKKRKIAKKLRWDDYEIGG